MEWAPLCVTFLYVLIFLFLSLRHQSLPVFLTKWYRCLTLYPILANNTTNPDSGVFYILNYRQPKRHWIISLYSRVILVYNLFHLLLLCCVTRQDYTKKREHYRSLLLPRVLKKYINPNVYFLLSLFKSCFLFFIYEELCIIKKTITARLQPK